MVWMQPWLWWLLGALALLFVDLLVIGGSGGFLLAFAVMAVAGLCAALAGLGLAWQFTAAALVGLLVMPLLLWLFGALARGSPKSGHDDPRMDSTPVFVSERAGSIGVVFLGDFFPARALDNTPLTLGEEVVIDHFQGVTAMVRRPQPSARGHAGQASQ